MNLDDVEAQSFAKSPNADGAVDQLIRADALWLRRCHEIPEIKRKSDIRSGTR